MRKYRFLWAALVAINAVPMTTIRAADVDQVEYIVSSQIVSDVVTGNSLTTGSSGEMIASGGGACADGNCTGAAGGQGGMLGNGTNFLAGARARVGDLRQGGFAGDIASGCVPRTYGNPDLFYNYYTQGNCNGTNAQMYLSPVPVPANVGHTFYTYQPFNPQEMLYWHTDRFHNYYDGGRGMNHTKVHYFAPPIRQAASNIYWNHLRIPR